MEIEYDCVKIIREIQIGNQLQSNKVYQCSTQIVDAFITDSECDKNTGVFIVMNHVNIDLKNALK